MSLKLAWFLDLDFRQVERALAAAMGNQHPVTALTFNRGLFVSSSCAARLSRTARARVIREKLVSGRFQVKYVETTYQLLVGYVHRFCIMAADRRGTVYLPMRAGDFAGCVADEEGTAWISAVCPRCGNEVKLSAEVVLRDYLPVSS